MHRVQPITVIQYGLGPIGVEIARLLTTKPWVKIVGAVDVDPALVGKDLGRVIGLERDLGVVVTAEVPCKADVVSHATGSRMRDVAGQLHALLDRGCHVVSTCEELSFLLDEQVREDLQHVARAKNVTLLGTGINPGFAMDKLPLTLTAVCQKVTSVRVVRVQNASVRREPLQRKIGAGLTLEEFDAAVASGEIKLIGLRESLVMIGNGLGVEFKTISEESITPIQAGTEVVTPFVTVAPGRVAGVQQSITGSGPMEVSLEVRTYVGADEEATDRITIKGVPDVEVEIKGGVHGDRAAAAMVVNAIPRVVLARPGVLTMDDIPISYR